MTGVQTCALPISSSGQIATCTEQEGKGADSPRREMVSKSAGMAAGGRDGKGAGGHFEKCVFCCFWVSYKYQLSPSFLMYHLKLVFPYLFSFWMICPLVKVGC